MSDKISILNGQFATITTAGTVDWAMEHVAAGRKGYLATVNVAILMMMRSTPLLQRFADQAALTVADGQPLVWVSKLIRQPLPERVAGVELVSLITEAAAEKGHRVYFFGGKLEVVEAVAEKFSAAYPNLEIAGYQDGYYTAEEAKGRAEKIAASKADIVFVGMGVPRQEQFVEDQLETMNASLVIPIGGSFDVISGRSKRAPVWMQKSGMEWLYRLKQEPGRLWKRYLTTNVQFAWLLLRNYILPGQRTA